MEHSYNPNNHLDNKNTYEGGIINKEDNNEYIKEESETKEPENNTSIDDLFFELCGE